MFDIKTKIYHALRYFYRVFMGNVLNHFSPAIVLAIMTFLYCFTTKGIGKISHVNTIAIKIAYISRGRSCCGKNHKITIINRSN